MIERLDCELFELVARYREALMLGSPFAPMNEQSLYALHLQELEALEGLLSSGAAPDVIAGHIARERRAFGWSFLSGDHGERVERAFHALASALEQKCP